MKKTTLRTLIRILGVISLPELLLKGAELLGWPISPIQGAPLFWSLVGCAIWAWSELDWRREARIEDSQRNSQS
ncbi:hypothetical protein [Paraburkholderia sp. BL17N1]|uniref:hypothetical protein n=1 Tax=Paraburkholderia sp. BL17N1 TaxID=1938798 RepID=UPI000F245022|nr:hypothetical protein [Paraburkholderia sp. BL17N1]RKR36817.1 hypothetical protein B0G82_4867 [Paraburkholderia sp. BL17N1]